MPKLQRALTHEVFFLIYSKDNQVIYSSLPFYSSSFKALSSTDSRYLADTEKKKMPKFTKGHYTFFPEFLQT